MADLFPNDNRGGENARNLAVPDAHGQAAMLLVESLIHGLIARSVISVDDAVEIVGIAAQVKEEVAEDMGDTRVSLQRSLVMLNAIGQSLRNDLNDRTVTEDR